jgi:hypothetical protein
MSLIKYFQSKLKAVLGYNLDLPDWSKAPGGLLLNQFILLLIVFSFTTWEMLESGRFRPYGLLVESLLLIVLIRVFLLWRRVKSGGAK